VSPRLAAVQSREASAGNRGVEGPDTQIIPGHGLLATKADLQAYREMLATVSARIKEAKRTGKTLSETIAAKPTAEFDEVWGKGFMPGGRFVEMIWKNLPN